MTSDERQEAARRLREIKPDKRLYGHVQAETVFNACGIDGDFGCVLADDLGRLADLIDPTCEWRNDGGKLTPWRCCACGCERSAAPNYCPHCGARVVIK